MALWSPIQNFIHVGEKVHKALLCVELWKSKKQGMAYQAKERGTTQSEYRILYTFITH